VIVYDVLTSRRYGAQGKYIKYKVALEPQFNAKYGTMRDDGHNGAICKLHVLSGMFFFEMVHPHPSSDSRALSASLNGELHLWSTSSNKVSLKQRFMQQGGITSLAGSSPHPFLNFLN
jgi:hypothetical protein